MVFSLWSQISCKYNEIPIILDDFILKNFIFNI